jgi:hypothetical protein
MKYLATILAAVLVAGLVQFAAAGDCCQRCGCQCQCRPVTCKIICDKKVEKYNFYVCECEDFCLPGPGCKTPACDSGCGKTCHKHCLDFLFKPQFCHVHHRKKLMKYECLKEVPVYKCVIVDLCPGCGAEVSGCGEGHLEEEGMEGPPVEGQPPKIDKPMPPKLPSARRGGLVDVLLTGPNR